jgi:hypothetical protein
MGYGGGHVPCIRPMREPLSRCWLSLKPFLITPTGVSEHILTFANFPAIILTYPTTTLVDPAGKIKIKNPSLKAKILEVCL